jgi:hypothetical protein
MISARRAFPVLCLVGLALAAVLVAGRNPSLDRDGRRESAVRLAGWTLPRLAERLGGELGLRVVYADRKGQPGNNAYLTSTDKGWGQLHAVPQMPEFIGGWQGTVYCERVPDPRSRDDQVRLGGDCCLRVGPFVFFGDRDLLARIRACLDDW